MANLGRNLNPQEMIFHFLKRLHQGKQIASLLVQQLFGC